MPALAITTIMAGLESAPIIGGAVTAAEALTPLGMVTGALEGLPSIAGVIGAGAAGASGTAEIASLLSPVVGSGITGGLEGLAVGTITGHPIQGLEQGGLMGVIGGAANEALQAAHLGTWANNTLGRSLVGAVSGAGSSAALGGNPATGALMGMITPALTKGFGQVTGQSGAAPGGGASGGQAVGAPAGVNIPTGSNIVDTINLPTSSDVSFLGQSLSVTNAPPGLDSTAGGSMSSVTPSAQTQGIGAAAPGGQSQTVGVTPQGAQSSTILNPSVGGLPTTGGAPDAGSAGQFGTTIPGATVTPSTTATGTTGMDSSSYLSGLTGNLSDMFTKNPLGSMALLGVLAKGQGSLPEQGPLTAAAKQNMELGQLFTQEAMGGVLPPGEQAYLDAQRQAAQAGILSHAAARGGLGSSATQQDIAATGTAEAVATNQLLQQLLGLGAKYTQMGTADYQALAREQAARDAEMQNALASLVGGLAGFGRNQYQQPTGN